MSVAHAVWSRRQIHRSKLLTGAWLGRASASWATMAFNSIQGVLVVAQPGVELARDQNRLLDVPAMALTESTVDSISLNGRSASLFAGEADLFVAAINVEGEIVELANEFFQVFRRDLAQVKNRVFPPHGIFDLVAGLRRDQAGQAHASTQ